MWTDGSASQRQRESIHMMCSLLPPAPLPTPQAQQPHVEGMDELAASELELHDRGNQVSQATHPSGVCVYASIVLLYGDVSGKRCP